MTSLSVGTAIIARWLYPPIVTTCVVVALSFGGVTTCDRLRAKHPGLAISFGTGFFVIMVTLLGIWLNMPARVKSSPVISSSAPTSLHSQAIATPPVEQAPKPAIAIESHNGGVNGVHFYNSHVEDNPQRPALQFTTTGYGRIDDFRWTGGHITGNGCVNTNSSDYGSIKNLHFNGVKADCARSSAPSPPHRHAGKSHAQS
jgi:hypothetical protein